MPSGLPGERAQVKSSTPFQRVGLEQSKPCGYGSGMSTLSGPTPELYTLLWLPTSGIVMPSARTFCSRCAMYSRAADEPS
jgi:hypothetical protein